ANKTSNENLTRSEVRKGSLYVAKFNTAADEPICLYSKASADESWIWHKKLSHLNFKTINSLVRRGLVTGLPQLEYVQSGLCEACQEGKIKRSYFKPKTATLISSQLQLI